MRAGGSWPGGKVESVTEGAVRRPRGDPVRRRRPQPHCSRRGRAPVRHRGRLRAGGMPRRAAWAQGSVVGDLFNVSRSTVYRAVRRADRAPEMQPTLNTVAKTSDLFISAADCGQSSLHLDSCCRDAAKIEKSVVVLKEETRGGTSVGRRRRGRQWLSPTVRPADRDWVPVGGARQHLGNGGWSSTRSTVRSRAIAFDWPVAGSSHRALTVRLPASAATLLR